LAGNEEKLFETKEKKWPLPSTSIQFPIEKNYKSATRKRKMTLCANNNNNKIVLKK
jgi:hypothetical protein